MRKEKFVKKFFTHSCILLNCATYPPSKKLLYGFVHKSHNRYQPELGGPAPMPTWLLLSGILYVLFYTGFRIVGHIHSNQCLFCWCLLQNNCTVRSDPDSNLPLYASFEFEISSNTILTCGRYYSVTFVVINSLLNNIFALLRSLCLLKRVFYVGSIAFLKVVSK